MPLLGAICANCGKIYGQHYGMNCAAGNNGAKTFVEAKLKQSTVVNGVTLTRKQIEDALADLNKPEPPPYIPQPGDVFTVNNGYAGKKFLALDPKIWRYAFNTNTNPVGVMASIIGEAGYGMDFTNSALKFTKVTL